MSQVSKYPISSDIEQRIYEVFTKTISKLSRPSQINKFFEAFLSPVERIMLAKRLSIALLLLKGYKYPEIRKVLRVSPPTISDVSMNLKYMSPEFRSVIESIIKDEKLEAFWNQVTDVISDNVPPGGVNWSSWRFRKEQDKKARRKAF